MHFTIPVKNQNIIIFNFKFEKGESNENPYERSNDIIVLII